MIWLQTCMCIAVYIYISNPTSKCDVLVKNVYLFKYSAHCHYYYY